MSWIVLVAVVATASTTALPFPPTALPSPGSEEEILAYFEAKARPEMVRALHEGRAEWTHASFEVPAGAGLPAGVRMDWDTGRHGLVPPSPKHNVPAGVPVGCVLGTSGFGWSQNPVQLNCPNYETQMPALHVSMLFCASSVCYTDGFHVTTGQDFMAIVCNGPDVMYMDWLTSTPTTVSCLFFTSGTLPPTWVVWDSIVAGPPGTAALHFH